MVTPRFGITQDLLGLAMQILLTLLTLVVAMTSSLAIALVIQNLLFRGFFRIVNVESPTPPRR